MHSNFQPDFKLTGKLTFLLAFSFFVVGCHADNEPVPIPKTVAKKETAGQASVNPLRNNTKNKTVAESTQNNEQNRSVSFLYDKHANYEATAQRDPFALPAELQESQKIPAYNRKTFGNAVPFTNSAATNQRAINCSNQQTTQQAVPKATAIQPIVPPYSPEPCVAGIFENSKEKFALVRWKQVHGVFRCGEHLGNGYYIKEITAENVLLYPDQNHYGTGIIKLTLH